MLLSPASRSSMSATSTSAMSPSDTTLEKPILRSTAQSSTAEASAPDCDRKASLPGCGAIWAKLALSPMPGTNRPRLFGPRMRSMCGLAASSISWRRPLSRVRPAVSTMAARVPRSPSSAMTAGTVWAGVATIARSGAAGREAMSLKQARPLMVSCFGFTGQIGPLKPASHTFLVTNKPTEPSRGDAPMMATERARKAYSRLRMVMRLSLAVFGPDHVRFVAQCTTMGP